MKSSLKKVALYISAFAVLSVAAIAFPPNYTVWKSRMVTPGTNIKEVEAKKGFLSSQVISRDSVNPVYLEGKLGDILDQIDETIVSYDFFSYGFIVIYDASGEFVASIGDRI